MEETIEIVTLDDPNVVGVRKRNVGWSSGFFVGEPDLDEDLTGVEESQGVGIPLVRTHPQLADLVEHHKMAEKVRKLYLDRHIRV